LPPTEPMTNRPMTAMAAQVQSSPRGLMRWTIGPAKNRITNMMRDV
jgi:hypothetical protein